MREEKIILKLDKKYIELLYLYLISITNQKGVQRQPQREKIYGDADAVFASEVRYFFLERDIGEHHHQRGEFFTGEQSGLVQVGVIISFLLHLIPVSFSPFPNDFMLKGNDS